MRLRRWGGGREGRNNGAHLVIKKKENKRKEKDKKIKRETGREVQGYRGGGETINDHLSISSL